jgi:hypothetical protein
MFTAGKPIHPAPMRITAGRIIIGYDGAVSIRRNTR